MGGNLEKPTLDYEPQKSPAFGSLIGAMTTAIALSALLISGFVIVSRYISGPGNDSAVLDWGAYAASMAIGILWFGKSRRSWRPWPLITFALGQAVLLFLLALFIASHIEMP